MTGTTGSTTPMPEPQDERAPAKRAASARSRVRTPILIAAALVLAGAAFGAGETQAISARSALSQARARLADARSQLSSTRTRLATAQGKLNAAQATAAAARTAATQANTRAQARYASAEARLARQTRRLDTLIGRVQASAISADGVYVVGHDIKAGTWHTAGDGGLGGSACYYATLNSTNTSDISDNNNFDGPETVSLNGVYAFQISGPCTWYRTGA